MRRAVLIGLLALAACGPDAAPPFAGGAPGAIGGCDAGPDWGTPEPRAAARLLDLVNAHRASRGLAPLRPDPRLDAAADWKARHMARYRYLAHDDRAPPVARPFHARIAACGFPATGTAENIAFGDRTPEAVMATWLGSAGHRANIEDPAYTHLGVGAARAANGVTYWAQVFARGRP